MAANDWRRCAGHPHGRGHPAFAHREPVPQEEGRASAPLAEGHRPDPEAAQRGRAVPPQGVFSGLAPLFQEVFIHLTQLVLFSRVSLCVSAVLFDVRLGCGLSVGVYVWRLEISGQVAF